MTKTTKDLADELRQLDEITLIELLHLRSDDIVDRFGDIIEERYDQIYDFLKEDDDDDNEEDPSGDWSDDRE
jgi:hypothetical protein